MYTCVPSSRTTGRTSVPSTLAIVSKGTDADTFRRGNTHRPSTRTAATAQATAQVRIHGKRCFRGKAEGIASIRAFKRESMRSVSYGKAGEARVSCMEKLAAISA